MNSFVILVKGNNLESVYGYIKKISSGWWKHMPSSMIVAFEGSSVQLRDKILSLHKENISKLVILKLNGEAAWIGINESGSSWLKNNI